MEICYSCGEKLQTVKDKPYHYDESGLPVVLHGITQYVCPACEESYAALPQIQKLQHVIGAYICEKRKALLSSEEIKFLRKDLHLKAKDLAKALGVTPQTVSRWENGKKEIGEVHDRLLRSIYMMYSSEQARHPICDGVIDIFKELPAKRKKISHQREIILNPQEWLSCVDGFCPA